MGVCFNRNEMNFKKQIILEIEGERYTKDTKITSGSYGTIWKCRSISDSTLYALK